MVHLGVEADGPVGAAALGPRADGVVERAGVVPREPEEDRVAVDFIDEGPQIGAALFQIFLVDVDFADARDFGGGGVRGDGAREVGDAAARGGGGVGTRGNIRR